MKKLTDYEKGWLEAMIDGEGSISLLKEKRPKFKAGFTYKPRINVSNTCLPRLEKAKNIVGGGCIIGQDRPDRKRIYNLDVSANKIREILPQIKLVAKEEQKNLLLKALIILSRRCGRGLPPRTTEEIKKLEEIYKSIRGKNSGVGNKVI